MTELFDLYDHRRQPLGQTVARGTPLPTHAYHVVAHVCVFNRQGQLLIQQRQPFKQGWPNLWDVSAAGSALHGETSQQAASRELWEELGYAFDFSDHAPVFTHVFHHPKGRGFDDFYALHADIDLAQLTLQKAEVQAVQWATLPEVQQLLATGQFLPYHPDFMSFLFHRCLHGSLYTQDASW